MKLNNKSLEDIKEIVKCMASAENSAEAVKALDAINDIQKEISWIRSAIIDARQAFWDGDEDAVGSSFEEIASYIDLDEED